MALLRRAVLAATELTSRRGRPPPAAFRTRAAARGVHTSAPALASGKFQHVEREDNTESTPFDFSDENYARIRTILRQYPSNYRSSGIIPLLDLAQRQCGGWLPLSAMNKVAAVLNMPPIRVYEVATFYTMFNREKIGRYNVQVCSTTPCMVRGAYDILDAVKQHLNIDVGEDTADGMFHLMEVECLGACANAPMVQINDDYYEDLTKESVVTLLEALKAGKKVKVGPQNGRHGCMGVNGKTTLFKPPPGPSAPYLDELDRQATAPKGDAAPAQK